MAKVEIAVKVVTDDGIFLKHVSCSEAAADMVRMYVRSRRYQPEAYFYEWVGKVEKSTGEKLIVTTAEFLKNFGRGDDYFKEEAYEG